MVFKHNYSTILLLPLILFSMLFTTNASAQLSPEAQADLLEQQMKRQLVQEKWADALASIEINIGSSLNLL